MARPTRAILSAATLLFLLLLFTAAIFITSNTSSAPYYFRRLAPSLRHFHSNPPSLAGVAPLSVAIFVAPSSPTSVSQAHHLHASITSWLHSIPSSRIFLLGDDPSFAELSRSLPESAIVVEPHVDYDFHGMPQLHSMFARARRQTDADVSVLVMDASISFAPEFVAALHEVSTTMRHRDWVMFSRNWAESDGGVEFWAWNNYRGDDDMDEHPLFTKPVPPFAPVVGSYEDWVMRHFSARRSVVDASDAELTTTTTTGRYGENVSEPSSDGAGNYGTAAARKPRINEMLLAKDDGSAAGPNNYWNLTRRCVTNYNGTTVGNLCLVEPSRRPISSSSPPPDLLPPHVEMNSDKNNATAKSKMGWTRTLAELLPKVADEDKVVVMVGGTWNYRHMLMSFICRAQSLGVKSVLVAAFDEELYEFAFAHGLGVYLESVPEGDRPVIGGAAHDGGCVFASECFKRVSKLKSAAVLRVLRMGYSVLWSDMDIYWFRNPVPELKAAGYAGTLAIQSDEPSEKKAENSVRGANSGFYMARSDEATIAAFEAIVRHAMGTDMTEQPSFYAVLCGEEGERRVGDRECWWSSSSNKTEGDGKSAMLLKTVFLSHDEYPNGNVFGYWRRGKGDEAAAKCLDKGCVLLHNNFIRGKHNKMWRFVINGMWSYDVDQGMCLQPWNPLHPSSSTYTSHFLSALQL